MIINICCFIIGLATGFIICTRLVAYTLKKELEKELDNILENHRTRGPRITYKQKLSEEESNG